MNRLLFIISILFLSCSVENRTLSNDSRGKIVAFNGLGETISLIDPIDRSIKNDIALTGVSPNHIKQDGDNLYLVNSLSNSIYIYSVSTLELVREVYLGIGINPWMIEYDSNNIYVTSFLKGEVLVISNKSYDIVSKIDVGTTPQALLVVKDFLVVTNTNYNGSEDSYSTGSLTIIDPKTLTPLNEIILELESEYRGINPQSMFFIPESNKLYIVCSGDYRSDSDGLIFIYRVDDFSLEEVIEIGGSPYFSEGGIDGDIVYLGGIGSIRSFNLNSHLVYDPLPYNIGDFIPSVIFHDNFIYTSMFNRDELHIFEKTLTNRVKILQGSHGIQQLLYIKK